MKKWVVEDWEFELTAIEGKASHCRLGLEKGDKFTFAAQSASSLLVSGKRANLRRLAICRATKDSCNTMQRYAHWLVA